MSASIETKNPVRETKVAMQRRCTALVQEVVSAPSGIEAIRKTDELSDTVRLAAAICLRWMCSFARRSAGVYTWLNSMVPFAQICKTYDAAELCRNVHTSALWRAEAQNACISLAGTHEHLIAALQCILKLPHGACSNLDLRSAPHAGI